MIRPLMTALLIAFAAALPASTASAFEINTAGARGAYAKFCDAIRDKMAAAPTNEFGKCVESRGTGENMSRVAKNPTQFGLGQLDVFALESPDFGGNDAFQIVRTYDIRECIFMVTRDKSLNHYGEILAYADRVNFVLPPRGSGHAKTFAFLQQSDRNGLGRAQNVRYASSTDRALSEALNNDNTVTLFVQFPDPTNERFRDIKERRGHIVPIVERKLSELEVNGQRIYFPQRTSIASRRILFKSGDTVVTLCTPVILFTGAPQVIPPAERDSHANHVRLLAGISRQTLVPDTDPLAKIIRSTRNLSDKALVHFQSLSRDARARARPFFERMYTGAQDLVRAMIEKARPPVPDPTIE